MNLEGRVSKSSKALREKLSGYVELYDSEIYPFLEDYRGFTRLKRIFRSLGAKVISSKTKKGNYRIEILKSKPVLKNKEDVDCFFDESDFCSLIYEKTCDTEVFCDVGGYRGFYSTISKAEKNHIFEPVEENRRVIKQHKNLNPDQDIKIVNKVAWKNSSPVSFVPDGSHSHVTSKEGDFETISLDSYFSDKNDPDVIKIDVEGSELEVLQGCKQVINRNRPLLFVEIHLTYINPDLVFDFFRTHNYKIGFIQHRGSEIQVMAY